MHPFLQALCSRETTPEAWFRGALEAELGELARAYPDCPELRPLGEADLAEEVRRRVASSEAAVARLFMRASWLLSPGSREEIERLDPVRDCDRIFHFVAREFRSELKVFAVLHEMRAAVSLPLATFFLQTGEFSERGVKRIVDTVLLVCNVLEWGVESKRGRQCLERIREIHARYAIPDAAFKFVLAGIMFIPFEFNQRFGFRRMTDVERLGWFHAFDSFGRAMGIEELEGDFDASYRWYREVSHAAARYGRNKEQLVRDILGQVLERYPAAVRAVIASCFVAGMDDVYLSAAGLPRAPEEVTGSLARLFAAPELRTPPRGLWLQSLLPSSVYPEGYRVEELGSRARSRPPRLLAGDHPISSEELARRAADGEWLVVLDGGVYDVSHFAAQHPGGAAVLARYRGRDATQAFAAAPHSAATAALRENYRVGTLVGAAPQREANAEAPRAVSSTDVLGVSRSRTAPVPQACSSLAEFAQALLPLVNARAPDPLSGAEVERTLLELCRF